MPNIVDDIIPDEWFDKIPEDALIPLACIGVVAWVIAVILRRKIFEKHLANKQPTFQKKSFEPD